VVCRLARGADPATAVSAAVAAVRETFEEAGVVFASPADAAATAASGDRSGFRRAFDHQGLTLTLAPLSPWSHWITPVGMPRRFDTRFFAAAAPEGQSVRPDGRETTAAVWLPPRAALEANLSGRLPLSPPTLVTLHQLLAFPTLDRLLADARERPWGAPILPRLIPLGEPYGAVIVEPWDPMYARPDISVDAAALEASVLPVGEPFSRIWNRNGFCRPVRV
jgi:8-oxo-dGTP pyrophosphatase MutT (NUDIX family)